MAAQKAFIDRNLQFVQVNEYLNRELKLAGQGKIEIHKTPMGHRVVIHAVRLGMVIGRRGRNIRKITDDLETIYRLETPQVEVKDLDEPRLNARVMAGRLISQIQKGFHFRRAGYALVRRIMSAEARGCEITIKGKLTSQRARTETFREGFVAKCGEPADKFVDEAVMEVTMKQGVIGVHVKIMQANAILPDDARLILNVFPPEEETEVVEETALTDDIEPEEITIEEEPLPEETTEIEEIKPEITVETPEVEEIVPEETKETKKAAKAKAAKEAKEAKEVAKAEKAAKAKAAKEAKEAAKAEKAAKAKAAKEAKEAAKAEKAAKAKAAKEAKEAAKAEKAEKAAKAKAAKEAKEAKKGKKAEKEKELLKKEDFNEEE